MSTKAKQILRRLSRIPTPVIFVLCLVVALLVLWWQGALAELWSIIRDASLTLSILGVVLFAIGLSLACYRWHSLIKMANDGNSDLPRASEAFLTSIIINYAAPVGLAVPSRAALTKRTLGLNAGATGTIALWEIGADVIVLGIGSVIWLILAKGAVSAVGDELGDAALQFILAGCALLVLMLASFVYLARKPILRRKVAGILRTILVAPKQNPQAAAKVLAVTVAYWVLQGMTLGVFVKAMDLDVTAKFLLGLTSLPILIGIVSPIPGGAVVRESLMYVVAILSDVPGREVIGAAVLYRMSMFVTIPVLYLICRIWIGTREHLGQRPGPYAGSRVARMEGTEHSK